jgi:hypothetical protein
MHYKTLLAITTLCLPLLGCFEGGDGPGYVVGEPPVYDGDDGEGGEGDEAEDSIERTHDCDTQAGYALDTHTPTGGPGLHIIGVYTARGSASHPWNNPASNCGDGNPEACDNAAVAKEAFVLVDIPGANTLLLTAYERTHWNVHVAPGSTIDRILVSGHHKQTVDPDPATEIVRHDSSDFFFEWLTEEDLSLTCDEVSTEGGDYCSLIGDEWQRDRIATAATRDALVSWAEPIANMPVSSFTGCYDMSSVVLSVAETDGD